MKNKTVLLKSFKGEKDEDRSYDILRALIITKRGKEKKLESMTDKQRWEFIRNCRSDTLSILQLRKKYPVINESSVKEIASREGVIFHFWTQQNTRSKAKLVTAIGREVRVIYLMQTQQCQNFYHNFFLLIQSIITEIFRSQLLGGRLRRICRKIFTLY